jgi:hypothetical protein
MAILTLTLASMADNFKGFIEVVLFILFSEGSEGMSEIVPTKLINH